MIQNWPKQNMLEMRNGNSIQKDENKYGGFFYFLHHFGPSIAGTYIIYIIWIVLEIIIFLYHWPYSGKKKFDKKKQCSVLFSDICSVSDEVFGRLSIERC